MVGRRVKITISSLSYKKVISGLILEKYRGKDQLDFYLIKTDDKITKVSIDSISEIEILTD